MTEGRAEEAKAEGIIRAEPLFHLCFGINLKLSPITVDAKVKIYEGKTIQQERIRQKDLTIS